jgi:putative hemolysin
MNNIHLHYLLYSLAMLALACMLASVFTSLRFTGDAGVPRLIERGSRHTRRLKFWQDRWFLLGKTAWLFLTLAAIAAFILFYLALQDCRPWFMAASMLFLSLFYMLVARIIPHVLSESYADRISLAVLPFMGTLTLLMYPFVRPLQFIEDHLLHHAMSVSDEDDRPSPEDEIKSLIEETDEEDLEEEEREIIRSVFDFGDTITREIMTPRVNISGLKDTLTVDDCIEVVKESRHSRFPVYHENIDDVVGIVHVKDLLRCVGSEGGTPIIKLVKKVDFVPETMPINDLMQLMKRTHSQVALVVDEYGGTEGLVSMEDIIEELVGEIEDEYDLKERILQQRPDGSVMVQACMPICDLNEELGARFPASDEYDSLGGYIFSVLGRIPSAGETFEAPGYTLRIHSATRRQIQTVHLVSRSET